MCKNLSHYLTMFSQAMRTMLRYPLDGLHTWVGGWMCVTRNLIRNSCSLRNVHTHHTSLYSPSYLSYRQSTAAPQNLLTLAKSAHVATLVMACTRAFAHKASTSALPMMDRPHAHHLTIVSGISFPEDGIWSELTYC